MLGIFIMFINGIFCFWKEEGAFLLQKDSRGATKNGYENNEQL